MDLHVVTPQSTHTTESCRQPLPMLSKDDALRVNYILSDFGCGGHFVLRLELRATTDDVVRMPAQPSRLHSNNIIR